MPFAGELTVCRRGCFMRLSGQKEFVIRFTGPFAKVENLTVISTSFLKKFTGQIVTIENSTVNLERCLRVVLQKMGIIP